MEYVFVRPGHLRAWAQREGGEESEGRGERLEWLLKGRAVGQCEKPRFCVAHSKARAIFLSTAGSAA